MSLAVHNNDPLRWRVGRREAARFRPRRRRKQVRRPNIVNCLTTATAATNKGQPGQDRRQRTVQVLVLCPPLCLTLSQRLLRPTMRELKFHEKKLLKKVDFLNVSLLISFRIVLSLLPVETRWPPSRNQSHEEVPHTAPRGLPQVRCTPSLLSVIRLTFPRSRYNKLCGSIRSYAHRLSLLPSQDPFRARMEAQLLSKLYDMGVLNTTAQLSEIENKLTVAVFCRRRLGVVMHRLKMAESVSAVSAQALFVDLFSSAPRESNICRLNQPA